MSTDRQASNKIYHLSGEQTKDCENDCSPCKPWNKIPHFQLQLQVKYNNIICTLCVFAPTVRTGSDTLQTEKRVEKSGGRDRERRRYWLWLFRSFLQIVGVTGHGQRETVSVSSYGDRRYGWDSGTAAAPPKVDLNERRAPRQRNSQSCPASSCTHLTERSSGTWSSFLNQTFLARPQPEKHKHPTRWFIHLQ